MTDTTPDWVNRDIATIARKIGNDKDAFEALSRLARFIEELLNAKAD